ncbi:MAG: AAA family ATPase [Opitutales bacterium]
MTQSATHCHPPGSGHQKKIWIQALNLKKEGVSRREALIAMKNEWSGYHKDISPAIDRAWEKVYSGNLKKDTGKKSWPEADKNEIEAVAEKKPYSLQELRKESPYPASELSKIPPCGLLQLLFPKDSLICLGESVESFSTKTLDEFCASEKNLPFIVPRTMCNEFGLSQDGKVSPRCNDNAGPERFVVIEFDDMEENVQVSMIKHLRQFLPLVLVLHSGGKSFHAWFNGCDSSEERVFAFRRHAASLGADKAVFTRCQMVRMPNQCREENGNLQELHYFAPLNLPSSTQSPSINFDKYPRAPELVASKSNTIKVPTIESLSEFKANCSPEPYELLEGTIYKGCKVALAGQSKAGKSHLAMQLAHAISTGNDFLGMSTRKSKVLYLNLELPDFVVNRRYAALESKISDNSDNPNLYISNGRGNWSGIESLDMMVDEIIEKGIGLIVVDPFYKVHDIDEIDQASVKKVLRSFDEITDKTDATLVYIHHFNKGKASDKNNIDLLAGSGVLARDFDSFMLLKENKDGKPVLEFILRCHPPKEPIILVEDYPIKVVDNESMSEGGGTLPSESEKVTNGKYCFEQIKPVLADNEPIASGELQKKVEDETGMKKSTFNALLKEAKECGLVKSQRTGKEILYELPEDEHVQTI